MADIKDEPKTDELIINTPKNKHKDAMDKKSRKTHLCTIFLIIFQTPYL
ncbi:MAG: hypothetical protein JETT_3361 [Candidatus Jettenia ecosi]|uniref:Uncharacterized protein n=1 Tax=Candidatus Jettenia ecosi TaxID=2494326 RepID=A0A533Q6Z8_9BACT|nr:MAG: hypothetical protein JETT_3361 [Candidatus Jettenia ecosi]